MKDKRGFTLAEILITIAIIAVLAGVCVPVFTGLIEERREANDAAALRLQYEQVMSYVVMGKDSVNINGGDFGKINLEQKKDGWQDNDAQRQVAALASAGVYSGDVRGGGTAWVSYRKDGLVYVNFGADETDGEGEGQAGDPGSEAVTPETPPSSGGGTVTPPDDNPPEQGSLGYQTPGNGDVAIGTNEPATGDKRPGSGERWKITVPDTIRSTIKVKVHVYTGNHGNGNLLETHTFVFDRNQWSHEFTVGAGNNGSFRVELVRGAIKQSEWNNLLISFEKL